jgi:hypothetical protein
MEERTGVRACFERPVGGAAEREKGRERGGLAAGVLHSAGGVVGPGPDRRAAPDSGPSVARAGRPEKEKKGGPSQMNSRILYLFELV